MYALGNYSNETSRWTEMPPRGLDLRWVDRKKSSNLNAMHSALLIDSN
ncbi:Glucan endo-1 [Psidium guajava]|nr:Glucan endo-1 [Psidium guajava]